MRLTRIAAVLDIASVAIFVVIGRASHVKGESLAGIASTSWPFLCGLAAGWALSRAWPGAAAPRAAAPGLPAGRLRNRPAKSVVDRAVDLRWPAAVWPAGVIVWVCTVAVGMVLRVVSGQGTAVAFVVVALVFLGLFLLGWRAAAQLTARSRWGARLRRTPPLGTEPPRLKRTPSPGS
jgi:hypothetical protein